MVNWPADQPERRALSTLRPFPRNARTHSPAQIAQVAESIREWGWTNAVLVDESGEIIAGHARVLAAQQLALTEVPVVVARGWTDAQKRAYVIADNKLATNAGWDDALLHLEFKDLKDIGFDLGLTGFAAGEIDELFAKAELKAGLTDPDALPEPAAEVVSRLGDVWRCGKHRIVCGDCTDPTSVGQALGGAQPVLMVTDPPYGVDYDPAWRARAGVNVNTGKMGKVVNDDRADWSEAWKLFVGDVAYVWHGALHASEVEASLVAAGFDIRAQIIWAKDRFALSRGHYHWHHEPCWYAVRKGASGNWAGDRRQSTLWAIAARDDSGHGHATQKPVETMLRPMLNNSRAGQSIYEPFLGSGTTLIAAQTSGRICHAVEINPGYVDIAVRRWQDFTGERATREVDSQPFPIDDARASDGETRAQAGAAAAQDGAWQPGQASTPGRRARGQRRAVGAA